MVVEKVGRWEAFGGLGFVGYLHLIEIMGLNIEMGGSDDDAWQRGGLVPRFVSCSAVNLYFALPYFFSSEKGGC